MEHEKFNEFLYELIDNGIASTLESKSSDYSTTNDKLYNFKLQANIDGITAIEALRGNWLKHRASICQGLNELQQTGKPRPYSWWREKCIDDINYIILLLAMLYSGEF